MTTYQSQTVYTEDREGNSLAFSTVNQDGEEAVLKAAVDVTLPDGQQVLMNVLYDAEDVAGLLAYLHDNFGGRGRSAVDVETTGLPIDGVAGWSASSPEDLQYYAEQDAVWQPKPGDTVHVVTATVTDHQTGTVVPIEPEGRQCPVIYSGLQCAGQEGHEDLHGFVQYGPAEEPFPQTAVLPQNDAGAVPPPADAQGGYDTPQSSALTPDQSAAESATAAGTAEAAPASTSDEKPKRKRRTKLEIAFDTAMEKWRKGEGDPEQVSGEIDTARKALAAKDPGNDRLSQFAIPSTGTPVPAPAESAVGFAPEQQPITNPFQQPAPLASGAQPVPGQVYAPDADGGIPAQAFQVPAFQPGQAPELGQTQVSPEEQQAAQGFPCPVHSSDGRPCQRPYGHELATAANPQPKPHVYATTDPSQLGQPAQPQVTDPLPWSPERSPGGYIPGTSTVPASEPVFPQGFQPTISLPFQVPPTPEATAPHPETNLQPPAPAAPSWAEPV